jgi:hypothetical protein
MENAVAVTICFNFNNLKYSLCKIYTHFLFTSNSVCVCVCVCTVFILQDH